MTDVERRKRGLARLAELGERAGRVFTLENLNTAVDHPGVPFAAAARSPRVATSAASPSSRVTRGPKSVQASSSGRPTWSSRSPTPGASRPAPLLSRNMPQYS